jgi:hypothetical protein
VLAITLMFSYSSVMFTEGLAVFAPRAAGAMLFGAVIIAVVSALFGAVRGIVSLRRTINGNNRNHDRCHAIHPGDIGIGRTGLSPRSSHYFSIDRSCRTRFFPAI